MALRLLHITDIHFPDRPGDLLYGKDCERSCRLVLEQAFGRYARFDLIAVTGDLANDPTGPMVYRRLSALLSNYGVELICLPGNHDHVDWLRSALPCPQRFTLPGWDLLCLNSQIPGSPAGNVAESEMTWLEQELAQASDNQRLILVHHNPAPTGTPWLDTMTLANGKRLLQLAAASSVKAVLHGHIHHAIDQTIDGIRILATPSTCVQFLPGSKQFSLDDKPPAYRVLTLSASGEMTTRLHWLDEKNINAGKAAASRRLPHGV